MQPIMNFVFLVTITYLYGDGECSWRHHGHGPEFWRYKLPDFLNHAQSQDLPDFGLPSGPPNVGPPGFIPKFPGLDLTEPWEKSNWDVPFEGPLYKGISPVDACLRSCPVTSEYNPVCGTNDITYQNPGRLLCARQCGVDVQIKRESDCSVPVGGPIQKIGPSIDKGFTASPAAVAFCMKTCRVNPDFKPVCGTNYKTYFNIDRLQCAQNCGEAVDLLCASACDTYSCRASLYTTVKTPTDPIKAFEDCKLSCSVTTEYNPVCGTNNVTYENPSVLLCSQYCGTDVKVQRFSSCSTTSKSHNYTHQLSKETCSIVCRHTAKDFSPVCGTNNITYSNTEELKCAKGCGIKVELKRNGPCQPNNIDTLSTTTASTTTTPEVTQITMSQDILDEIFGINQSKTPYTTTTESENYDIDIRFGDSTET